MQNLIPKFSQNSIISEKPGYFSEKLKALASSNYNRSFFFSEILRKFPTEQCLQKGLRNFFSFCVDLELLIKI